MNSDGQSFEQRKMDHIRLALDSSTQNLTPTGFSKIKLLHQAIPNLDFKSVSLSTKILNNEFGSPHFISSMTAGHKNSLEINKNLAEAALEHNWMMCVGSQRRELTDSSAVSEWQIIRKEFKNLKLLSNIGILEVITEAPDSILKIIDSTEAIALLIHLNPLQEVFQNNQEVNFSNAYSAIEKIVKLSPVPVVVKEVGFGINKEIARKLFEIGVNAIDVAGAGGTHWAVLESLRQPENSLLAKSVSAFSNWGQTTIDCLLEVQDTILFEQVWASGGIRNGVDSTKCLAMGARAVGIAQPLMEAATKNSKNVSDKMTQFDFELKTAMFCCGISKCEDFLHQKVWYGANS